MPRTQQGLLLAGAMIALAVLAKFELVPQEIAQYGPAALLAMFPSVWLGRGRSCRVKP